MSTGGDESLQVSLLLDAGPAAPVVAEAVAMFRSIIDVLNKAREESDKMANATTRIRDSLRDIRALQGSTGAVSDEYLRGHLGLIRDTGMTQTEAHDYVEQFLGEAAAYKDKMKPEEFERVQTMTAQYALSQGMEPGVMAKLAGRVIAAGPEGQTAEQVLTTSAEFFRKINLGSGVASRATEAAIKAGASLVLPGGVGQVESLDNLAALAMGASRSGSEAEISTRLQQFSRAMTGTTGSKAWNEYVREYVPEGTKAEVAMRTIFGQMEKVANVAPIRGNEAQIAAQTQALAEGSTQQGRDLNAWLYEKGVHESRTRTAIIAMYAQRNPMYAELEGRGPEARATDASTLAARRAYITSTEGDKRLADAELLAASTEAGMRLEETRTARTRATAQLVREGVIGGGAEAANALESLMTKGFGFDRATLLIEERARKNKQEETRMDMSQPEPGVAARLVGRGATLPLEMAAGMIGMVSPSAGEGMNRFAESTRASVAGRVRDMQGLAGNDLTTDVETARHALEVGDLQRRMVYGPSGKLPYGEYQRILSHGTEEEAKILAHLKQQALKPLLTPRQAQLLER